MPGLEDVRRVLAVAAHPDDLDFGCAGTLARLADAGAEVTELIATRGDSGSSDPDMTRERLARLRTAEAEAAAAVLGVDLVMLDYEDGYVGSTIELRRDISRHVRSTRPDLVMIMDPAPLITGPDASFTFVNHPDHRAVAQAALDSLLTGGPTRLVFPELAADGLEPHKPGRVALYGPGGAKDFSVDVTATIERKVAALRCHASQVSGSDVEALVREWARRAGAAAGCEYAEVFHLFDVVP